MVEIHRCQCKWVSHGWMLPCFQILMIKLVSIIVSGTLGMHFLTMELWYKYFNLKRLWYHPCQGDINFLLDDCDLNEVEINILTVTIVSPPMEMWSCNINVFTLQRLWFHPWYCYTHVLPTHDYDPTNVNVTKMSCPPPSPVPTVELLHKYHIRK